MEVNSPLLSNSAPIGICPPIIDDRKSPCVETAQSFCSSFCHLGQQDNGSCPLASIHRQSEQCTLNVEAIVSHPTSKIRSDGNHFDSDGMFSTNEEWTSTTDLVQIEDSELPNDSGVEDDYSSTTSVASSIFRYPYENGRRYHAYKSKNLYMLPNDEPEQRRLDRTHEALLCALDGELHVTHLPHDFTGNILELGAGTGIWAIDMGDKYPGAVITSIDLSPIQPVWVPPNVHFQLDDIEAEWTFNGKFDLVFSRILACSIRKWRDLMSRTIDALHPGGRAEWIDWDFAPRLPDGTKMEKGDVALWHRKCIDIYDQHVGATARPGPLLARYAGEAGFEDIHEKVVAIPVGQWPKDKKLKIVGGLYGQAMREFRAFEAISLRAFTSAGMAKEDVYDLIARAEESMRNTKYYYMLHIVTAQKPL